MASVSRRALLNRGARAPFKTVDLRRKVACTYLSIEPMRKTQAIARLQQGNSTMNSSYLPAVCLAFNLFALSFIASDGIAADLTGSADHPAISRYEGSEIIVYDTREFDEFYLFTAKATSRQGPASNADATHRIEGKVTSVTYRNPAERTTLEVLRNYQDALMQDGFEILFDCSNETCGGRNMSNSMGTGANSIRIGESYGDQRYIAAKRARPVEGDLYVSLYVAMANVGGGADYGRVITRLDVIELKPMATNMVTVDADAMRKAILSEGHIAIYGILFDLDKADIKPESKPTLDQIAKLLSDNPDLELVIVGHTDNQGTHEYNMDLSNRRAKAVMATMTNDYKVASDRLKAWGAGFLAPVASNQTDAGRAKNRRVELVEQ